MRVKCAPLHPLPSPPPPPCPSPLVPPTHADAQDSLGATPLILSVQHKQGLATLALLSRGANPAIKDVRGAGLVHWAAYKGAYVGTCVCVHVYVYLQMRGCGCVNACGRVVCV